jgi:hypothetical protein
MVANLPAIAFVIGGILGLVGQGTLAFAAFLIAGLLMLFA